MRGRLSIKGCLSITKGAYGESVFDTATKKPPYFRPSLVRGYSAQVSFVQRLLATYLDGRVATVDEDDLAADGIRGRRSQDRTRSAISTGRPNRPDGIWAFIGSPFSGAPQACRPISVRNTVGATAREHLWW